MQATYRAEEKEAKALSIGADAISTGSTVATHTHKMKNYNIAENAKNNSVKTSKTQREAMEGVGIAGDAAALYVAGSYDGTTYIAACLSVDKKTLKFGASLETLLCIGDRGIIVRHARVSACGKFALFANNCIAATGVHGKFELRVTTDAELLAALKKGEYFAESHTMVQADGVGKGTEYSGIGFGLKDWKTTGYASLAYVVEGRFMVRDNERESHSNNRGKGVVCAAVGEASEKALAALFGAKVSGAAKAVPAKGKAAKKGARK